ncbi:MAG: cation diffusion facilitator family transporter [Ignavibacteria bacterium]|nr:cation diffusion facilitator family transporter [Ignavibacteria bacterium]
MHNNQQLNSDSLSFRLIVSIILNLLITVAEIIGGLLSGSLALISDALHNFSDAVSIIISYIAIKLKKRDTSYRHTFGLMRAEILAAVINSSILVGISIYLFYEAVKRFYNPEPIESSLMIIVAVIGLIANLIVTFLLKHYAKHSINIKSAYLHIISDVVSSIGVILGGVAIYLWDVTWVDPLLTILIGLYILKESYQILMKAIHILMEGAPLHIKLDDIKKEIESIDEVQDIHHLHIWTIGEKDVHLETHINVNDMLISQSHQLREKIEKVLEEKFGIKHITLQLECNQCLDDGLIKSKYQS